MSAPFRVCSEDCCSNKSPTTVRDKVNNSTSSQRCCIFQGFFSRAVHSEWLCALSFFLLFFSLVDIVAEVLYSISQYGVWVCALRLRTAGGVDFCVILPPPPLPHLVLSTLPLSLSLFPSVSPSPTHLMLPTSLPPSFSPVSRANTVPCRVGRVMKKCAPPHLLFHHQRSFSPLHCALTVSSSLPLSLSSFSLSVSVAPLFLLQPHARGRLKLCEGKKEKKSAAISTVRASPQPALP